MTFLVQACRCVLRSWPQSFRSHRGEAFTRTETDLPRHSDGACPSALGVVREKAPDITRYGQGDSRLLSQFAITDEELYGKQT